jgi:hypothetical protein
MRRPHWLDPPRKRHTGVREPEAKTSLLDGDCLYLVYWPSVKVERSRHRSCQPEAGGRRSEHDPS